ncbi:uncharacterized protein VICG_01818 [Vittaforma corneae ATCC 50505]|uniref:Poly(A) polymerase n=1 Tax=Vittaforma corneae (strain ATCC 50505) TaxID=993615 RepID=L2GKI3_VITCO|nr:uncharacterized protein VICG_01818 [Vittaforma corneae ATCC 50505]ELA41119.1 hypothetical protein VICG_01818 [Vittaforma corneae ATCC 50505]
MNSANPKYGITGPASLKESTQESTQLANQMDKYLRESNFFESEDAGQTRERVLGRLDFLVKKFVEKTAPEGEQKNYGGKIFTFGSYRLGVHDRGADIDVLCVVPRHVSRKDFFTIFYEELGQDENVKEISKIEDAYVPIISLTYDGIPIDLTFARLNLPVIAENISLLNDTILRSMDEKCILSLNGSRVTDAILRLIPRVDVFHSALRAIKFWAKRRYIYGNAYGYFGGVTFSICVARICQMYPNLCAYDIVCKFFETYSSWKWPTPVQLCSIVDHNYNLKVWDPKVYPADKYHKMPVITPVYPSINSTHNVTQSTFILICSELARGNELMRSKAPFSKLFEVSGFFKKHKMFIEVRINSEDLQAFNIWEGYIQSKIRILCTKLENLENISLAAPFPKAFTGRSCKASNTDNIGGAASTGSKSSGISNKIEEYFTLFYIAVDVSINPSSSKKIFVGEPIGDFLNFVNSWEGKLPEMKIEINSKKKKEIQSMDFIKNLEQDK